MIGPTSRGGSRNDIKKIQVAAMRTPSATPDRSQYVPRRRAATRSSRPTMGRILMARQEAWFGRQEAVSKVEHPTSNSELPSGCDAQRSMFDVGCWMLDVSAWSISLLDDDGRC